MKIQQVASFQQDELTQVKSIFVKNLREMASLTCQPKSIAYPYFKELNLSMLEHSIRSSQSSGGKLIVAEDQGRVIGFMVCLGSLISNSVSIEYAAVRENARRKGVFTEMMAKALSDNRPTGLCCHPHLHDIYRKFGFKTIGQEKDMLVMATDPTMATGFPPYPNNRMNSFLNSVAEDICLKHGTGKFYADFSKVEYELGSRIAKLEKDFSKYYVAPKPQDQSPSGLSI